MAHAETTILNAFAGKLVSMTTVANDDVHKEYAYDFTDEQLPAINLRIPESVPMTDQEGGGPTLGGLMKVAAELWLEGYAKTTTTAGVGNVLRAIDSDTKKKIRASGDTTLGGVVEEVDWLGSSYELSGDEEQPVGKLTQRWRIVYQVSVGNPDTIGG